MYAQMNRKIGAKFVGDKLLELMAEKDMTQADLARATNRQRSVISETITGKRGVSLNLGRDMARAFGLPEDELFRRLGLFRLASGKPAIKELEHIADNLSDADLEDVLEYARHRLDLAHKRGEHQNGKIKT